MYSYRDSLYPDSGLYDISTMELNAVVIKLFCSQQPLNSRPNVSTLVFCLLYIYSVFLKVVRVLKIYEVTARRRIIKTNQIFIEDNK